MFAPIAQLEAAKELADHASAQSDRWLFLATVIALILFFLAVIKFLIKDRELARVDHAKAISDAYALADAARKEHAATMQSMVKEHIQLSAQLLVALQENNMLISKIEKLLDRVPPK